MDIKSELQDRLQRVGDYYIYLESIDEAEHTVGAIVRKDTKKQLIVLGSHSKDFIGTDQEGIRFCDFTSENAKMLQRLFPYTAPKSHKGHRLTIGLGDRLGLATPGHIRAIKDYDVYPILAQQSMRELSLTKRNFEDLITAVTFGVFQEGYKLGYGADGDHLKTKNEILLAISGGCTMITLDCSEHIKTGVELFSREEINRRYNEIPSEVRNHYENKYLWKKLPIIGMLDNEELKRIVITFWQAIRHAIDCYFYIEENKNKDMDFEMSIDETREITSPAEHYVIADELIENGVRLVSMAPHYAGEFEKGIEYQGNLAQFVSEFETHQKIAQHFGYKLSVHSGSDKFFVFSTVGRVTEGNMHVKTSGTNWLEAMRIVATAEPDLYRKAHKYAIEHRKEAEKYYHITTKVEDIPDIDYMNDSFLPEYMNLPASRQTIHIAYGMLLSEEWFRDAFFQCMADNEEAYYEALKKHIGKHLQYLSALKYNG